MDEVPGAWSMLAGEPVKLFRPAVESSSHAAATPGTVLQANGGLVVAAGGTGAVRLDEVQPSGGRRMGASEWIRGRRIAAGARFD
jgi:methionyl-tRNA formyltransferase